MTAATMADMVGDPVGGRQTAGVVWVIQYAASAGGLRNPHASLRPILRSRI